MPTDGIYNESPVVLPSLFGDPGTALRQQIALNERARERQYDIDYRNRKDLEAEQWRKLNLIQDLTDLSKHQTGSDVANALGNTHAAEIFQKYTQAADKMNPMELQASISKDMSSIINGMEGTKNELENADKQIAAIKTNFPDLNISQLAQDARTDILHRRLDDNAGFVNPLTVPQSSINLSDPDFLSKYVTGDKNLRTYFQNPQGMDEMSVFKGSPNSYTKYTAKVPAYKKPSFDPATLKAGFMITRGEPSLKFKSSFLPSDALPSSKDKPFEMMDKDVYDSVTGKEKLELTAATRKTFPNYDSMNQTEKEYAQRHVLLNTAKAFDQTGFHPTEVHTPSASLLKFYAGDKGAESAVNDVYSRVKSVMADPENAISVDGKKIGTVMNALDADSQKVIFDLFGGRKEDLNETNTFLADKDGVPTLYRTNDDGQPEIARKYEIGALNKLGTNIKAQPGIVEKREVIKQGNQPKQKTYKGLDKQGNPIFE